MSHRMESDETEDKKSLLIFGFAVKVILIPMIDCSRPDHIKCVLKWGGDLDLVGYL